MQSNWNSHVLMVGICNVMATLKNCLATFTKLNIFLPFDSAFLFLYIVPKEIKIFVPIQHIWIYYLWFLKLEITHIFILPWSSPQAIPWWQHKCVSKKPEKPNSEGRKVLPGLSRIALSTGQGQLLWFFSFPVSLSGNYSVISHSVCKFASFFCFIL